MKKHQCTGIDLINQFQNSVATNKIPMNVLIRWHSLAQSKLPSMVLTQCSTRNQIILKWLVFGFSKKKNRRSINWYPSQFFTKISNLTDFQSKFEAISIWTLKNTNSIGKYKLWFILCGLSLLLLPIIRRFFVFLCL